MRRLPLTGRPRWGAADLRLQPGGHGSAAVHVHIVIPSSTAEVIRTMPYRMSRAAYAQMFGPTVGDRVRLADTDLLIEVEKDFTTYGEEVKFGGGKVIRDGMGQSQRTRSEGAVDTVIT